MVYRNRHRNAKRDQTTIGKIIQNTRAARLFSLAMALTMVLVAVSVCIQYRNVQDQRKTQQEWHGAWQAVLMDPDLTALQEASENLVIKKRGSVQTAAMKDGTIAGTGDKQFFEMANLSIKKGRLPETGSEMAAEALWLDERGFSYRIGQKIQIDEKVFTLAGILDSYTANWTAGNHVPQIWITRLDKPEHTLLYMQAKSGYEAVFDEWSPKSGVLVRNMYLEYGYQPFSASSLPWTIATTAAAAGGLGIMFMIVSHWLDSRQLNIIRLKSLGADTGLLMKPMLFLFLGSSVWVLPVMSAVFLAFRPPWFVMAGIAGFWMILLLVLAFAAWVILFHIPSRVSLHAEKGYIPEHLPTGRKTVSCSMLAGRWLWWNWKPAITGSALLAILAGIIAYTATGFWFDTEMEKQVGRKPDFRFYPASAEASVSQAELQKIRTIPGVREMYSYTIRNDLPENDKAYSIGWEGMELSPVYQIPGEYRSQLSLFAFQNNGTDLSPVIIEPDELPPLADVLKHNGINLTDLNNDDALLYLPAFSWTVAGSADCPKIQVFPDNPEIDYGKDVTFRTDVSLAAGQEILIRSPEGQSRTARIPVLVRQPLNYTVDYRGLISDWTSSFSLPYVVIVPKGFFGSESANRVEVWTEGRRDAAIQSDMAALASHSGMKLQNDAVTNEKIIRFFADERLLYCVLTVVVFLVWIFILCWSVIRVRKSIKNFLNRLRRTGTDTRTCLAIRNQIVLRIGLASIVFTGAALTACLWLQLSFIPNLSMITRAAPSLVDPSGQPAGVLWILLRITPATYGFAALSGLLQSLLCMTGTKQAMDIRKINKC